MSGGAVGNTAGAKLCGTWAFSTSTCSTLVLLAAPQACIMSPRALSPSGVKLCQPQTVSLVPFDLPAPAAGAAPAAAGGACAAAGRAQAANRTPQVDQLWLRNIRLPLVR